MRKLATEWGRGLQVGALLIMPAIAWSVGALVVCSILGAWFPGDRLFPEQTNGMWTLWRWAALAWVPLSLHQSAPHVADLVRSWQAREDWEKMQVQADAQENETAAHPDPAPPSR